MTVGGLVGQVGDLSVLDFNYLMQLVVHHLQLVRQLLVVVLLRNVLASFLQKAIFQPGDLFEILGFILLDGLQLLFLTLVEFLDVCVLCEAILEVLLQIPQPLVVAVLQAVNLDAVGVEFLFIDLGLLVVFTGV